MSSDYDRTWSGGLDHISKRDDLLSLEIYNFEFESDRLYIKKFGYIACRKRSMLTHESHTND